MNLRNEQLRYCFAVTDVSKLLEVQQSLCFTEAGVYKAQEGDTLQGPEQFRGILDHVYFRTTPLNLAKLEKRFSPENLEHCFADKPIPFAHDGTLRWLTNMRDSTVPQGFELHLRDPSFKPTGHISDHPHVAYRFDNTCYDDLVTYLKGKGCSLFGPQVQRDDGVRRTYTKLMLGTGVEGFLQQNICALHLDEGLRRILGNQLFVVELVGKPVEM